MKNILDSHLVQSSKCGYKRCPSDEDLKVYPMLDEDHFDQVDECLYRCAKCRERMKEYDHKN